MVLASLITCTELTVRHKQVHVVAAYEVLCQVDDSGHQALFAVVVGGHLRDVADKLCDLNVTSVAGSKKTFSTTDLNFLLEITLEA